MTTSALSGDFARGLRIRLSFSGGVEGSIRRETCRPAFLRNGKSPPNAGIRPELFNGRSRRIAGIAGRDRERRRCDGKRTFMHLISAPRNLLI